MSNPIYYFLGLILALSYPTGYEPLVFLERSRFCGMPVSAAAALAGILACGAAAWTVHRWMVARGRRNRIGLARAALRAGVLVYYAVLVFIFHFPLWVWDLGLEGKPLLGGLAVLSPLAALHGVLALVAARWEARVRGRGGVTAAGYLGLAFRTFVGLSLIPVVFILGIEEAFMRIRFLQEAVFIYPFVAWLVLAGLTLGLLMVLPTLLRAALGARPFPVGPVRERLEEFCRKSGFRFGGLWIVGTGGLRLANAFIVGMFPCRKHVFFTDAIVESMEADFLECVLAHEVAHARRKHLPAYLLFSVGFAFLGTFAHEMAAEAGAGQVMAVVLMVASVVFVWGGLFGFVSRRFESEADLAAARTAGTEQDGPGTYPAARRMADTLGALAQLNGVSPAAWSWRHFRIERRMEILDEAEAEPARGETFERLCRQLRGAIVGIFFLGLGGVLFLAVGQLGEADLQRERWEAYEGVDRALRLREEGLYKEAAELLTASIGRGADEPRFWLWAADCWRLAGHERRAAAAEERARRGVLVDPRDRLHLAP